MGSDIFKVLCWFSLFLYSCSVNQDYNRTRLRHLVSTKPDSLNQKLLISLGSLGKGMLGFQHNHKISDVKFMDENRSIDRENHRFDPVKFERYLVQEFPDKDELGICYFDFESPFLDEIMHSQKGSINFERSIKIYIDAYKLGKKLRPNVIFGHYNIPFTSLEDPSLLQKSDKLEELMELVDVFFPSIYLNNDYQQTSFEINYEYVVKNIQNALKYASKFNKPIFPFVMHRYHSDKTRLQFAAINSNQWKDYLEMVTTVSYKGKYVDGIVWWGADDYFFDKKEGVNIRKGYRFKSKEDFVNYNDPALLEKARVALSVLK